MRTSIPFLAIAVLLIVLAACGGGAVAGAGGPPPAADGVELPGARITVTADGALAPGMPAIFRVTCSGSGAIAGIDVLIGDSWEEAVAATVRPAGAGAWDATVLLPTPLAAGSAVLVRLTFADGNVVETSTQAFPLSVG